MQHRDIIITVRDMREIEGVVFGNYLVVVGWGGPYLPSARGLLPTSAGGWPAGTGHIPRGKLKTDIKQNHTHT